MTANQMLMMLNDLVDKNTSLSTSGLSDRQISEILTIAEFKWVKTRYNSLANKYREGFDSTEIRRKGLDELIKSVALTGDYSIVTGLTTYNGAPGQGYIDLIPNVNFNELYAGMKIEYSLDGTLWTTITLVANDAVWSTNRFKVMTAIGSHIAQIRYKAYGNQNLPSLVMNGEPDGSLWRLPKDCLWLLTERVKWNDSGKCWNNQFAYVKPVTYDDYNLNIDNTFRRPSKDIVWRLDYSRDLNANIAKPNGDPYYPDGLNDMFDVQANVGTDNKRHILITDGTPIGTYYVVYIRRPRGIWCDTVDDKNQIHCEIDESYHIEIVNEAVKVLEARIGDPRYTVQNKETVEEE